MHAQRHTALAGDSFDLDGELTAIHFIDTVSDNPVKIGIHHFADRVCGKPAVFDQTVTVAQIGKNELVPSPDIFILNAAEAQRIEFLFLSHSANRVSGLCQCNREV